ncbi:MAG: tetratricopeptide repeat protein [Acidobacteria bacterium]|nr:tetratricopeptide repeat protein [Acidobacteriota bacterium]
MTVFQFHDFQFDDQINQLKRGDQEIKLQPKVAQLLAHFLNNQGDILSKDDVLRAVWSETAVTDHVLFQSLKKLRAILKQDKDDLFIKTYPGQGYQWVCVTNEQVPPTRRPMLSIVFVAAIVLTLGLLFIFTKNESGPRSAIAVSDFRALNTDIAHDWYGTAIAEILRADLTSRPALRLISGESTARATRELKLSDSDSHAPETMNAIRRYLGTDYWVDGSYLLEGDQLHLNLVFQETEHGSVVFTLSQTGQANDMLTLVRDIANTVAQKIGKAELPDSKPVLVTELLGANPEAAKSYMLGLRSLRTQSFGEAVSHLEAALAADPDSPLILSRLAQAWSCLGYIGKAQMYAEQAQIHQEQLTPTERLMVQATLDKTHHRWLAAANSYQALFTLFPDEPDYGLMLADALIEGGDPARATEVLDLLSSSKKFPIEPRITLLRAKIAQLQAISEQLVRYAEDAVEKAHQQGSLSVEAESWLLVSEGKRKLGHLEDSFSAADKAMGLFQELDDRNGVAEALIQLGNTHMQKGALDRAESNYLKAFHLKSAISQQLGLGSALNNLGAIAYRRNRKDQAHQYFSQAKQAFDTVGDIKRAANTLINMGIIQVSFGNFDTAFEHYQNADVLYRSIGNIDGQYRVVHSLATLFHRKGDPQSALSQLKRAVAIVRENQLNAELPRALMNYGMTQRQLVDIAGAQNSLREAVDIAVSQDQTGMAGQTQFKLGSLFLQMGDLEQAKKLFTKAAAAYREIDEPGNARKCQVAGYLASWESGDFQYSEWEAFVQEIDHNQDPDVLLMMARVEQEEGRSEAAVALMRAALERVLTTGDVHQEIVVRRQLVEALISANNIPSAAQEFETASRVLEEANFPFEELLYQITKARLQQRQQRYIPNNLDSLCRQLEAKGLFLIELEAQILRARIARDQNKFELCESASTRAAALCREHHVMRQSDHITACEVHLQQ